MKKLLIIAIAAGWLLSSCSKDGTTSLNVMLTDDPTDADAVNVEILQISVHIEDSDGSGWHDLDTEEGIYDLLELQNDVVPLADNEELPPGKLGQLRMMLGENNTIVFDQDTFDLKVPSGYQTGIKINIGKEVLDDESYEIILDFDAEASVVETGDGNYLLKPVIKVEEWKKK